MNYDLDDLMRMSNHELSQDLITYYRDVARTADELRRFLRNAPSARPFEDGVERNEQGRASLHASLAVVKARGVEIVQSLCRRLTPVANHSSRS